ncbi:MAG: bifunctional metallophosphatase/5'-nucleotidase [Myxococcota bacterium]
MRESVAAIGRVLGGVVGIVGAVGLGAVVTLGACAPEVVKPPQPVACEGAMCGKVAVQLVAWNDFHGQLEPPTGKSGEVPSENGPVPAGGVEYLATWVDTLKQRNPNTVVVAAGDNIGASPLMSAAFHDEPTIEALNAAGLMITSVGNHEFDEGIVELSRMQAGGCHPSGCFGGDGFEGAKFEYLAANVVRNDDKKTLFPPYTVRRFGKVDVAFIGLTLEGTPNVVTAKGVEGVSFRNEVETVNEIVPQLQARGIHAIVVLIHEGGFPKGRYDGCDGISGAIVDIAKGFDKDVDVVVSGHTHQAYLCDIGGKLVTSAGHYGRLLTDIDLVVDEATGDVVSKQAHAVIVTRDVPKAAAETAIVDRYRELVKAYADEVVTTLPKELTRAQDAGGQSTLGMVIADAQLAAESDPSTGGAEIALMNPGGIRTDLPAGPVTFGALFATQPFGNNLVTVTLSGKELEQALEEQFATRTAAGVTPREEPKMLQVSASLTYVWDTKKAAGDRIDAKSVRVNGKPLDAKRSYRVVMNAFLAGGGDGFATLGTGRERKIGVIDLDALVSYLRTHPGLTAPSGGRVTKH